MVKIEKLVRIENMVKWVMLVEPKVIVGSNGQTIKIVQILVKYITMVESPPPPGPSRVVADDHRRQK